MGNIVPTDVNYNSRLLHSNIFELKNKYPFLQISTIGLSVLTKPLWCIKLGVGPKEVFYSASIHANEWITSPLLMKFIENFCIAYVNNETIFGYSAKDLFNETSIYIVPMCNPDGVDLVTGLVDKNTALYTNTKFIADRYPNFPFPSGWKANIRGVDLNLQFPARMGKCKRNKICSRICLPCST